MAWNQRLPSGKWRGLYRDSTGKVRSAGTFAHEQKALAKAIDAEEESRLPGWRDPMAGARKWKDWQVEWWKAHDVAPSTRRADASLVKVHVLPKFGETPLADITRFAVREWAVELRAKGLSEATVQRAVRVLSTSLSAAVDADVLRTNPCFRLGLDPGETDVMRFYTRDEVTKMLKGVKKRDRAIIALLAGTGLRWGEMQGLSPKRVDLERGYIRVAEVMDQHTREVKAYPKGRRIRDVPIPDWVAREIKPFVKAGGPLLFEGLHASNWRRDVWVKLDTSGRIHDLRHTYASWLLQGGVPIAEVSVLMGHSSTRVTERYAHIAKVPTDRVLSALADPRV